MRGTSCPRATVAVRCDSPWDGADGGREETVCGGSVDGTGCLPKDWVLSLVDCWVPFAVEGEAGSWEGLRTEEDTAATAWVDDTWEGVIEAAEVAVNPEALDVEATPGIKVATLTGVGTFADLCGCVEMGGGCAADVLRAVCVE